MRNSKIPSKAKPVNVEKYAEVIHSALLADAQYDYSRLEMQIMLVLLAAIQDDARIMLRERFTNEGVSELPDVDKDIQIFFSFNDFPVDMKDHEGRLYRAAKSLVEKPIKMKEGYGWSVQPLISKVDYVKENRNLILTIRPQIWKLLIQVYPRFAEYEILPAFHFSSVYSVRLYMIAGSIEHLP